VWFFQNGATLHRLHSLAALGACWAELVSMWARLMLSPYLQSKIACIPGLFLQYSFLDLLSHWIPVYLTPTSILASHHRWLHHFNSFVFICR
jgi:hypothetical protein